jgi:hypothetical protein
MKRADDIPLAAFEPRLIPQIASAGAGRGLQGLWLRLISQG